MRTFPNPVTQTHPFAAIALLCLAAMFAPALVHADELSWNNTDNSNHWTGTATNKNWVLTGTDTSRGFDSGDSVVFGDIDTAEPGTIIISSSGGVTIGASGTNPGMIVTGTDDWEFVLTHTTGTVSGTGIGLSGSGAGVLMEGTGTLTFSMTTGYTGATDVRDGTLRLNVADAIAQSSGVTLSSSAKLDLGGHNQSLKALAVSPGANVVFSSTGADYRTLALDSLTGDGGVFDVRVNVGSDKSDRITISGTSEGAHELRFTHYGDTDPHADTFIPIVIMPADGGATFTGTTEKDAYTYEVQRGGDGSWYLSNTDLLSRVASAVIASAAVAGQDWHYELDALYKRMGELREPPLKAGADLWFRASASRVTVDKNLTGRDFHQYSYGGMLGVDKAFHAGGSTFFAGVFGVMNRVDRDFKSGGEGRTDSTGGGLYLTWLHETGWFADVIGRMDRNKNQIDARTVDGYLAEADYDSDAKGFSIEFGRRMLWNEEWWFEPAVQYASADIDGDRYQVFYDNRTPLDVHLRRARASQTRISLRIGETYGANPGWHPYAKFAAVYSDTKNGRVSVGGRDFTADFDGWRWEVGFGAAYVLGPRSQVYYDYEYTHATHYTRPWAVNLGFRFAW